MTTDRSAGSDVPAYILAGGQSRRFGSDKARARYQGVPLITAVADSLRPVAESITVVAAEEGTYDDLGLRTVGDIVPGQGPLGGLLTALEDADCADWVLVAACDVVGLHPAWFRELLSARTPAATAVVFSSDRFEPMPGLYHVSLHARVREMLGSDDRSMQSLLAGEGTISRPAPPRWPAVRNLNRPFENELEEK